MTESDKKQLTAIVDKIETWTCACGGKTCKYCGHRTHLVHSTAPLGTGSFGKDGHCAKCGNPFPPE